MAPVFDASVYGRAIADVYDGLHEATTTGTSTTECADWHRNPIHRRRSGARVALPPLSPHQASTEPFLIREIVMQLPMPRGPLTALLFEKLTCPPHEFGPLSVPTGKPVLEDDDLQLALFACYELHYQGFDGVDEGWEWNPSLLAGRQVLERRLEDGLAQTVARPIPVPTARPLRTLPTRMRRALVDLVAVADEGPRLSIFLERKADLEQFREFAAHRSIYHLKEADPHTWAIPRLRGRAKAALVEIQADEYGDGRLERMHSELFRATMRALELDDGYGAYLDRVPAITLALSNTMSLFGLHRRHRGALLGHLAAFEMTSSIPNRRYSRGLRRLGGDAAARRFYDEHVRADAVHEQIAAHDMCGGFAQQYPSRAGDVLYGAACALTLERLFAEHVLQRWTRGITSLRQADLAVGSK